MDIPTRLEELDIDVRQRVGLLDDPNERDFALMEFGEFEFRYMLLGMEHTAADGEPTARIDELAVSIQEAIAAVNRDADSRDRGLLFDGYRYAAFNHLAELML